jgi:hypothetical protein
MRGGIPPELEGRVPPPPTCEWREGTPLSALHGGEVANVPSEFSEALNMIESVVINFSKKLNLLKSCLVNLVKF